jgi:hypothetical protein
MVVGSVPWLMSQHDREGIVYNTSLDGEGLGLKIRPHPIKRAKWQEDLRGHRDDLGKRWEFMLALPKPEPVVLLEPRVYKPYEPRFVPVPMPKGAAARLEAKKAALVGVPREASCEPATLCTRYPWRTAVALPPK